MEQRELKAIKVGARIRQRLGDLASLKASIDKLGLLQPIVVDEHSVLISGWRRLQALTQLHEEHPDKYGAVPVFVAHGLAEASNRLMAERDENTCREEMNGFELAEISRRLLDIEKPAAAERERAGLKRGSIKNPSRSDTVSERGNNGRAIDHVAAAVHVSAASLAKGIRALEAYENAPEKFAEVKVALEKKQWTKAVKATEEGQARELTPKEELDKKLKAMHASLERLWRDYPRHRPSIVASINGEAAFFRGLLRDGTK